VHHSRHTLYRPPRGYNITERVAYKSLLDASPILVRMEGPAYWSTLKKGANSEMCVSGTPFHNIT
jgi:hypothetical protein